MEYSINRKRLIKTFTELIKINSPSFMERRIGNVLAKRLACIGCDVRFQEYKDSFNLIAFKRGNVSGVPPVLLNGHMDTIEPTNGIKFSIDSEIIKSVGNTVLGADDKSALAQIIEALTVIDENRVPHGDIEVVFTSAEEKGLVGAKNLDLTNLKSRYALVLDSGGSVGKLVVAAPTHLTYEIKITGKSAHAGIEPEKGINSIRVASEIICRVPDGRINSITTANIGMIKGGTATNVVPKETVINGEIRSHSHKIVEETKNSIFNKAREVAKKQGVSINISTVYEYKRFKISKKDPFLRFIAGVMRECNIEPVFNITGGGSDANIFNQKGITTINISNGMQKVHTNEEYILIEDLCKASEIVLKAVSGLVKIQDIKGFQ